MKRCVKIIVTFGMPSAGKTTTLKEVVCRYKNFNYYYDDSIRRQGTCLNKRIKDIFEFGEYDKLYDFQLRSMRSRYEKYFSIVVPAAVDEMIYNTQIYTKALYFVGFIKKSQYEDCTEKYMLMLNGIKAPDMVLYVKCSLEEIKWRMMSRGLNHEKFYTDKYLEALYSSTLDVLIDLKRKYNVYEIDTTEKSKEQVVDDFIKENGALLS